MIMKNIFIIIYISLLFIFIYYYFCANYINDSKHFVVDKIQFEFDSQLPIVTRVDYRNRSAAT